MKKDFEMTQEQLDEIMNACKPTPVMYLSGGQPMFGSPQENANYAWEKLGKELGFKHMTVRPNGKGNRFFSAEESETAHQFDPCGKCGTPHDDVGKGPCPAA